MQRNAITTGTNPNFTLRLASSLPLKLRNSLRDSTYRNRDRARQAAIDGANGKRKPDAEAEDETREVSTGQLSTRGR